MLRSRLSPWLTAFTLLFCIRSLHSQNFTDLKPSPQHLEWQDLEFGVIIHFATNTFLDREWGDGSADPRIFAPTEFDPEQWMRAIRAAGAKYVVLVGPTGSRSAVLEADFAKPVTFDHSLTIEWLNDGQRVEHYRIEVWNGKSWVKLVEGHAIGHKQIDTFAPGNHVAPEYSGVIGRSVYQGVSTFQCREKVEVAGSRGEAALP